MHEALQLGRFEGVDFKYENSFFKFHIKNVQIRYFWSPIQGLLVLHQTLQKGNTQIGHLWSPKHSNRTSLVPNFKIFIFVRSFAISQIRGH